MSASVEATLGTVSESDEHAALRALARALALELDSILASADHSPTHTAPISAQLRATLAELSIGTNTSELEAFFHGELAV